MIGKMTKERGRSAGFGVKQQPINPMKTNPSFRIFKPSTLVSLGIAIAAALTTQPVRATAIQTLVITEFSSTSLTATLNGTTPLTVSNFGADEWFIALAGVDGGQQNWFEPGAASDNFVQAQALGNRIEVLSDHPTLGNELANGATDTSDFTLNAGELDVTFIDKGDVAGVPDTGSTLGLLSLSVVALLGATRLRFLQLAA
jgi:hypothetical protein